ncbi:helix-turn-helix transcriptional regulator [Myxococcus sp. Y35]|uniref:helix-turn-helix transcriptional regulator n=1 Tax=Pseudomyxococcus flavus TaxID=3115648 RepID=UPI003CE93A43
MKLRTQMVFVARFEAADSGDLRALRIVLRPPPLTTYPGRMAITDALARELAELARLRRARDLMDREFERELDVASIARAALMSPAHFSRRFRQEYGESPYSYLMTRRIERAMALLRRGDLSVTDVCMAVGCSSLGSFSASFTRLVGMTPSNYRALDHTEDRVLPACIQKERTRPRRAGLEKQSPG